MTSTSREQVEGTCLVVGAACVFALVALVVKVDPVPLLVATELRFLVSWAVAILFMLLYKRRRGLQWFGPAPIRHWLLLKCAASFAFITLWWAALQTAPMGDCIAIVYCAPILVAVLSLVILGEALPKLFFSRATLVSIGCLLVLNPPFLHTFTTGVGEEIMEEQPGNWKGYCYVFCALIINSLVPIITRKSKEASWIEVEHVSACLNCVVLDPSLIVGQYLVWGAMPDIPSIPAGEMGLILLAAMGSFVGIAMETKGYQLADPGKASLFRYVEVPFAYVLQKLGTTQPIETSAIIGSILILSSCALGLGGKMAPSGDQATDEKKEALLKLSEKCDA